MLLELVNFNRDEGEEGYETTGFQVSAISFDSIDTTFTDPQGHPVQTNATMVSIDQITRGSFILKENIVYEVRSIQDSMSGIKKYSLQEVFNSKDS